MQTSPDRLSQPLRLGSVTLPNRVFLAPMSGVTDRPFRQRAAAHGAGMVVSEMVASGELARGRAESARRLERIEGVAHVVQLAGREASAMAEAARIAVGEGADIVDINMGCPAKKVVGGACGSALMREPDHALRLVEAVVGSVDAPVTVKMRLGWDSDCLNAAEIAARCEAAGVAMIAVHGRNRMQFYAGRADWAAIGAVKRAVSIPVAANGDAQSRADAEAMLEASGADAVMIGRGHYGRPWLAGEVAGVGVAPDDIAAYVADHYEAMLLHYGRERGLRHARKHLGWYLDRFAPDVPDDMRQSLMTAVNPAVVMATLRSAFSPEFAADPAEAA